MDNSGQIYYLESKLAQAPSDIAVLDPLLRLYTLNGDTLKALKLAENLSRSNDKVLKGLEVYFQSSAYELIKEDDLFSAYDRLIHFVRLVENTKAQELLYLHLGEAVYKLVVRKGETDWFLDKLEADSKELALDHFNSYQNVIKVRFKDLTDLEGSKMQLKENARTASELITLARLQFRSKEMVECLASCEAVLHMGSDLKYNELKKLLQLMTQIGQADLRDELLSCVLDFKSRIEYRSLKQESNFLFLIAETLRSLGEVEDSKIVYQKSVNARIRTMKKELPGEEGSLKDPDFLIFGVMKCGTSSLYDLIIQHPSVLPAATKELHFIQSELRDQGNYKKVDDKTLEYVADFYPHLFPKRGPGTELISGEASGFSIFEKGIDRTIKRLLPNIKLIAIIRDPIKRAVSHYNHRVRAKAEQRTLEQALVEELEYFRSFDSTPEAIRSVIKDKRQYKYLVHGFYHYWLKDWIDTFGSEKVYILDNDQLRNDQVDCLNGIFDFLGLDHFRVESKAEKNSGNYRFSVSTELHSGLRELFQDDFNSLKEILSDQDLEWFKKN